MTSSSGAQFKRSTTRILRDKGIDPSIKCTSTLVANYNTEDDANVRLAMRTWLDTLIVEFSKINPGSISRNTITEFVNLAEIDVRGSADKELVRRVYTTIRHVVTQERKNCQVYYVLALEYILSTVASNILQEDARSLVSLAECLIEMTDPQNGPLNRASFAYNASCLNALERALTVLHELERHCSEQTCLVFFEEKVKKHLSKIISCQHYYPFAYHAFLFKENIDKLLKKETKTLLLNAGRRAFFAFCGGLHIFQGVRELAVLKFDFSAMESGVHKFREAFKDISWDMTSDVQEVVLAASETVEHEDFGVFQQCYDKYKKVSWVEGLKWSKQKMTRYALVSHLCLFCTGKHSESVQVPALKLLESLATKDEGKQWRNDDHIFEAMVDAFIAIGKDSQEYKERVIDAINTINSFPNERHKKIIRGCLEGKSIGERIVSEYRPDEDTTNCSLFKSSREKIRLYRTASICNRNQQTLKEYYKVDSFAKVSLFSDKNDQRHIDTFEFNLQQYEKVVLSHDCVDPSSRDNYNQRENNLQRIMKVRKPIRIQDLFKTSGTFLPGRHKDAQRILVIGNPGTGKTCLSKRICFDWAMGSWGSQFTHLYLLPIRRLTKSSIGTDVDLPLIIRQLIYKTSGTQDRNNALYKEIKDNLSEATTLLILDGYDEAGEMAMDLVHSAFSLNCGLLILSRPHSVNDICRRVSIEVECLEFSNNQLKSFICKELGSKEGGDLMEFLNANISIKDTCRVAVNSQIVARLWRKASYRAEMTKTNSTNLSHLYSMMSNYIWRRFTQEREDKFKRDSIYHSLECIAFESFRKNLAEIPEELVMDHAQETEKVFRHSGFLLFMEEGSVFQFAHLTFHEYFAGRYLAKLLKSTNGEERKKAERVISEHKYIETSRVMLSFMTQCYCMRDDIEVNLDAFKDLMQVLESYPLPSISLQHLFLRMRTLDAFIPCGIDKEEVVPSNEVIIHIVNDAMDALKRWFGYELGEDRGPIPLVIRLDFQTLIADELSRMPNLFNQFPDLLKPILLNELTRDRYEDEYRRAFARIGRLNPNYAIQCILPMLDNWTNEEQANMIQLCAFIRPVCAEPVLDHLKRLCRDQDPDTRMAAARALVTFIDLFPEREDVRQLMVDALRDPNEDVRFSLMRSINEATFAQETEVGTFVWDLLIEAMKDNDDDVREYALQSCVQHYQTFAKSVDEVMEFVRKFAVSPVDNDREYVTAAIGDLIPNAPEQSKVLLVLLKTLCADPNKEVRSSAVYAFLEIARGSYVSREDLFNLAFDIFKNGYPNVQVRLLPFLFSFDKEEIHGIDEVNEWIATCQDLDASVREKVDSCRAAHALLSEYTIEEIHDKFYDQYKVVQMELVTQFGWREMDSNKASGAIAKMAVQCLQYEEDFKPSIRLLNRLGKTELFPRVVVKKLAKMGYLDGECFLQQPLSHLLEYYWSTADPCVMHCITEKLLHSAVIFEKKGETEMAIAFRENGTNVKQTAPVEVVQKLLSRCNDHVRDEYGLDFPHV